MPHTSAPRRGKSVVVSRVVCVFGSVGCCCGAANAPVGQHKKAKWQRPWLICPHTSAPRRGKSVVVSRKGRIFGSAGCCGAANALEVQHKKAKWQRPWLICPHTSAPRRGKSVVVSRKGRIFRRTGCCIIAKIPNTRLGNFAFCGARAGCRCTGRGFPLAIG